MAPPARKIRGHAGFIAILTGDHRSLSLSCQAAVAARIPDNFLRNGVRKALIDSAVDGCPHALAINYDLAPLRYTSCVVRCSVRKMTYLSDTWPIGVMCLVSLSVRMLKAAARYNYRGVTLEQAEKY